MAKGVEDTAFYRYVRLLALNEVGGDPARFGIAVDDFHAATPSAPSASRAACWSRRPTTPSARPTSRARLGALSAMPDEWAGACALGAWHAADRRRSADARGGVLRLPDARRRLADRRRARCEAYLVKALREAKRTSSWIEPDEAHEARGAGASPSALLDHGAVPLRTSTPFAPARRGARARASRWARRC